MIPLPAGVRVWISTGHTDMRKGMPGLALQVQEHLKRDPHGGDLFVFRGRGGGLGRAACCGALGSFPTGIGIGGACCGLLSNSELRTAVVLSTCLLNASVFVGRNVALDSNGLWVL